MKNNERLLSLDVLRGIDLMLLVGLQPILRSFLIELDSPLLNETLLYHLDHAESISLQQHSAGHSCGIPS